MHISLGLFAECVVFQINIFLLSYAPLFGFRDIYVLNFSDVLEAMCWLRVVNTVQKYVKASLLGYAGRIKVIFCTGACCKQEL